MDTTKADYSELRRRGPPKRNLSYASSPRGGVRLVEVILCALSIGLSGWTGGVSVLRVAFLLLDTVYLLLSILLIWIHSSGLIRLVSAHYSFFHELVFAVSGSAFSLLRIIVNLSNTVRFGYPAYVFSLICSVALWLTFTIDSLATIRLRPHRTDVYQDDGNRPGEDK